MIKILFLLPVSLFAILIGNPGEPALSPKGIFTSPSTLCTVRTSFFEDYVYYQRFLDKFTIDGTKESKTYAKLATNAGLLTLNFEDRLDLYGILGASRLQINQEIYSKMQFSWGFGGKLIIVQSRYFYIGADFKYFATSQNPIYFVSEGLAFNVVGDFELNYTEKQTSLGLSIPLHPISPYIYATYLIAKFDPHPMTALVQWPLDTTQLVDAVCNSANTLHRFGLALGATILAGEKSTLAIESRMFNQNAVDVKLEIKF